MADEVNPQDPQNSTDPVDPISTPPVEGDDPGAKSPSDSEKGGEGGSSGADDPLLKDEDKKGSDPLLDGEAGKDDTGKDEPQDQGKEPTEPFKFEDLKVPEGTEVPEDIVNLFMDTAKELKLGKEAAQELLDIGLKHAEAALQKAEETNAAVFEELKKNWFESLRNDREYGGPMLDATLNKARMVLKKFAPAELLEDLKDFGFTYHGGLIKFLARVADVVGEDSLVGGSGGVPKGSLEERLYPTMANKER